VRTGSRAHTAERKPTPNRRAGRRPAESHREAPIGLKVAHGSSPPSCMVGPWWRNPTAVLSPRSGYRACHVTRDKTPGRIAAAQDCVKNQRAHVAEDYKCAGNCCRSFPKFRALLPSAWIKRSAGHNRGSSKVFFAVEESRHERPTWLTSQRHNKQKTSGILQQRGTGLMRDSLSSSEIVPHATKPRQLQSLTGGRFVPIPHLVAALLQLLTRSHCCYMEPSHEGPSFRTDFHRGRRGHCGLARSVEAGLGGRVACLSQREVGVETRHMRQGASRRRSATDDEVRLPFGRPR